MLLTEPVKSAQSSLASYCRTGELLTIPGIDREHVKQYRRLVYHIIDDSLQSAYPLTYQFLDMEVWGSLVNEFFTEHPCQSPQVWKMPQELYEFMLAKNHPLFSKHEFLHELMWMEWLEVELYMMDDIRISFYEDNASGQGKLVINPESRLLRLNYPVHLKNAGTMADTDKGNYYLSMHRDPRTGKIIFNDLSIFFFRMLEKLSSAPQKADSLMEGTAAEFGITADQVVRKHTYDFFEKTIQNRLIIGFTN